MVPQQLLRFSLAGGEVVPHYFMEADHPWLRALMDEYQRFEGKPRRGLVTRLAEPLPVRAPQGKLKIACHTLNGLWRYRCDAAVPPKQAREALFRAGSCHAERASAVATACAELDVDSDALLEGLFADLPYDKVLVAPKQPLTVARLAQKANLALVAGMLRRAEIVRVEAHGNLRALVRQARLKGLLCSVNQAAAERGETLEVSGPYSLFRRTLVYGRALASLVPVAAWCERMEMRAHCFLDDTGDAHTLVIRSGDPLFPAPEPSRYDSRLEQRFARQFAARAVDWDIIREPEAVRSEGTLIFPDFELRHRRHPERRWLLEIAGFWTPQYLADKLRRLRAADLSRFILCIDEERNCSAEQLPSNAHVLPYRRSIDVDAVLRIVAPEILSNSTNHNEQSRYEHHG